MYHPPCTTYGIYTSSSLYTLIPVVRLRFFLFFSINSLFSNPFLSRFQRIVSTGASPSSHDDVFFRPPASRSLSPTSKGRDNSNSSKYDDESVMKVQQVAAATRMTFVPTFCGHDDADY